MRWMWDFEIWKFLLNMYEKYKLNLSSVSLCYVFYILYVYIRGLFGVLYMLYDMYIDCYIILLYYCFL